MAEPDYGAELKKLAGPLTEACELAERLEDFVLAAKLSDCIEWINAARYDGNGAHDV